MHHLFSQEDSPKHLSQGHPPRGTKIPQNQILCRDTSLLQLGKKEFRLLFKQKKGWRTPQGKARTSRGPRSRDSLARAGPVTGGLVHTAPEQGYPEGGVCAAPRQWQRQIKLHQEVKIPGRAAGSSSPARGTPNLFSTLQPWPSLWGRRTQPSHHKIHLLRPAALLSEPLDRNPRNPLLFPDGTEEFS